MSLPCRDWRRDVAVAKIAGSYLHWISAAHQVMEKTPCVILVGKDARIFVLEEGLQSVEVNSPERLEAWQNQRAHHPRTRTTSRYSCLAQTAGWLGGSWVEML